MARPVFGWVLVGWLCAAGAAFATLFDIDATDDYAGWIPAIVAVQVPAFVALRPSRALRTRAPRERAPLAGGRRWALALPAALAAGVGVCWTAVAIGYLIWPPTWLEFRPLVLGLGVGLVAVIAAGAWFARILRDVPHPRGAKIVVRAVAALGVVGIGAMVLRFGGPAYPGAAAEWLMVVVPVLWVIPLWIVLALEPPPEPPIPRVIVAR